MSNYQTHIDTLGPWFHNIHLPDGTQTAPDHFLGDFPTFKWREIAPALPPKLDGWKVLDVGCNAGFYSIELAKRGAQVTAIDIDLHYLHQARWVAECFGLADRIEFRQEQVYDLARDGESYDLIWFMGVFYHLRYPLLALDILGRKCRKWLLFQTLTMPGGLLREEKHDASIHDRQDLLADEWPKMAFIEHRFAGDPTNWWLANESATYALLRSTGFEIVANPTHETLLCQINNNSGNPVDTWNRSEYLSAIQQPWLAEADRKLQK